MAGLLSKLPFNVLFVFVTSRITRVRVRPTFVLFRLTSGKKTMKLIRFYVTGEMRIF